jgi:hypothetical protein
MTLLGAFFELALFGLPLVVLAGAALATTGKYPMGRNQIIRNKFSGYGIVLFLLYISAAALSMSAFQLGVCNGGWIDKVHCARIPNQLGFGLIDFAFTVIPTLSAIGFPSLGCYVLAEIITRWRIRKTQ